MKFLFYFVVTFLLLVTDATQLLSTSLINGKNQGSYRFSKKFKDAVNLDVIKPGSKAKPFQIWTLHNGLISYPGPHLSNDTPIGFHAYTNKSGFLECMWKKKQSLVDFVNTSPANVNYVFMTFDNNAIEIVSWMKNQLAVALDASRLSPQKQIEFMSRCFFVITPVFEIGNWISSILSDWSCTDHGCGFNQLVFYSDEWQPSMFVSKRVDARYDWTFTHTWKPSVLNLYHSTDPCNLTSAAKFTINGSAILISDDITGCTIAKQVYNLQVAGAAGVIVYSKPGYPLQDLNCQGDDCNNLINIPVTSIHYNSKLLSTLTSQHSINVYLQNTPSPNFYFTINARGEVVEPGWFLYPSMQFMSWQMQWLIFEKNLTEEISKLNDYVVPVYNRTIMQGKNGTGYVTVSLDNLVEYDRVFLDMSLSCVSDRDEGCPPWDHVPELSLCCEDAKLCNVEIGRWITSFRRGIGHWLTDISPLLPLFSPSHSISHCTFNLKMGAWWAQPWVVTLLLRFQRPKLPKIHFSNFDQDFSYNINSKPSQVIFLFQGGIFDKNYNSKYHPIKFTPPSDTIAVYVFALITGHGSDNNGCGEFCVTSHNFIINQKYKHVITFSNAGTPLGCADRVPLGVVPNEHGTWLYGRDGWCDGQQVDPWVFEITNELNWNMVNSITYAGLFNGKDPDPTENPGEIRLTSYLVYYRS